MIGVEVILILGIAGLMVFFLVDQFLEGKILNPKSRTLASLAATVGITPILYVMFIIGMIAYMEYYPKSKFDANQWEMNQEGRYVMSKDIIKSEILIGKTKEEIIELLGDDFSNDTENLISYYIGFVPGMLNIDPDILEIYFKENKVIKVSQRCT